jgi:hypothetical protein
MNTQAESITAHGNYLNTMAVIVATLIENINM